MEIDRFGAWVSSTKLTVVAPEVLPATSVWRTATVLLPSTEVKVELQVLPPSTLYSTVAPVSRPPIFRAPLLEMLSVGLALSVLRTTLGAATCVSSTKLTVVAPDVLPATSVWRTATVLLPSTGVRVELQVLPPSTLYSTVAPASVPPMVSAPELVMPSELLVPLSVCRETLGAATWVSSTKLTVVAPDVLPATSVWRTETVLLPSTGVNVVDQLFPPSVLYSIVAPASMPPMVREPELVMLSELLAPLSISKLTVGAETLVSLARPVAEIPTVLGSGALVVADNPSVSKPVTASTR